MSRIFISHSSANNAEAIALRDWLVAEGWSDLFLDLDPQRGIAAGERWERALNEAARRCEAVIFLISKAWLASRWCTNELTLARRLNKRLFGVLVEEGLTVADLPHDVTSTWQLVNLATGRDHKQFRITLPVTGEEVHVTYSLEGLTRLKGGLQRAGLHASYFNWPPETDPKRAPYRGLRPLEGDDAGIFFGREAPVIEAIDRLRGLTEAAPPRLMVILGASGAGKSSFLRAGLLPRLGRDPQTFLPLPPIRPERAALSGETGLLSSLATAFEATSLKVPRGEIREAIGGGAATLKPLLARLQSATQILPIDGGPEPKPPTLVIPIDQGEELFLAEAQVEAQPFLALLRELLLSDSPAVIAVFTIRSDNYERLQMAPELEGVHQQMLNLPPMPKGSYAEVVKGPIRRLDGTARAMKIDDKLVDEMLADIEAGGAKDALPLLAFTLERLYEEYGATGHLTLDHYVKLGRVKGSIEAAVERAFKAADNDSRIPRDRTARLTLLRRGLIPWLAGIDPDTKAPRRRVARLSEIPAEARPLVDLLVEQRLLSIDVAKDTGETTIEPAHEALLRQWSLLQGWLSDDTGLLTVLDGIKRAARDWAANAKASSWLAHSADRLRAAERLMVRPDLAANLEPMDKEYVVACQRQERAGRRSASRTQAAIYVLLIAIISGLLARMYERDVRTFAYWAMTFRGHQLAATDVAKLKPGEVFSECAKSYSEDRLDTKISKHCPDMVVVPSGSYRMGEWDKPRVVTIKQPFAVSRFAITFDQWDACVAGNGCDGYRPSDSGWGRGTRPVIDVHWKHAQLYVDWLNGMAGAKIYRLLSEGEWEYAARGITSDNDPHPDYPWGEEIGKGNANCDGCGSQWDNKQTAPVGSFKPNAFGLYDMHGNVWQWVEDCYESELNGAPTDGSIYKQACKDEMTLRVRRGGSWLSFPQNLRSIVRNYYLPDIRDKEVGFRVARTLLVP